MIPEFKRPELEDKELIDYYFAQAPSRSCERTFANVYLWSRHYKVKYAILHNALVFRDEGDGHTYAYPVGKPEASTKYPSVTPASLATNLCSSPLNVFVVSLYPTGIADVTNPSEKL